MKLRSIVSLAVILLSTLVQAAPGLINYSGRLVDAQGNAVMVPTPVAFSFYNVQSGGAPLASYLYQATITPNMDGLYSVAIGDTSVGSGGPVPAIIFDSTAVWLNVNIGGEDLAPRARITTVGYAFRAEHAASASVAHEAARAFRLEGGSHVMAESTGTEVQNGQALLAAWQRAKLLQPHGKPLSASNRAVLLVPPGRYDLDTQALAMDTEFVDIVGLSTARENQWIYGKSAGLGTGVIVQTANNIRIENLRVELTATYGSAFESTSAFAYFPDTPTTFTVVNNCSFDGPGVYHSMRAGVDYAGQYTNCTGEHSSFGSRGTASGQFTDCTGGQESFGTLGTASGIFTRCIGDHLSFAGWGIASGTFKHCIAGDSSFGGGPDTVVSGRFENCSGGAFSFGASHSNVSGTFINCRGGSHSFGGGEASILSGYFENCTGGNRSFGGNLAQQIQASAHFTRCKGGDFAFSSLLNVGTFRFCEGGSDSFSGFGGMSRAYCLRNSTPY